jgi:hypothetical protein
MIGGEFSNTAYAGKKCGQDEASSVVRSESCLPTADGNDQDGYEY